MKQKIDMEASFVTISSSDGRNWYSLLSRYGDMEVNCIDSYILHGGAEQPFEYITMVIPRRRLTAIAPELAIANGIIPGKTKLRVYAIGTSTMTVVKCKKTRTTYTITAYCDAEILRGKKLSGALEGTPFGIINTILTNGEYSISFMGKFIYACNRMEEDTNRLKFKEGTNVWYVLQVCAIYLGCKIFFSEDYAYLLDYRIKDPQIGTTAIVDYGPIDLQDTNKTSSIYNRISGQISMGDEGVDTVANAYTVRCSDSKGGATSVTVKDIQSISIYGERAGSELSVPELRESYYEVENEIITPSETNVALSQASQFASNLIDYRKDAQQSITFTVKEVTKTNNIISWEPFFDASCRVDRIVDTLDDLIIDNTSNIFNEINLTKLFMSDYERNFPEGTTTYTFGLISNVDLASSTSQILTTQGAI